MYSKEILFISNYVVGEFSVSKNKKDKVSGNYMYLLVYFE